MASRLSSLLTRCAGLLRRRDVWAFLLCVAFFLIVPDVDRVISSWFYDAEKGFYLGQHPWVVGIYHATNWLMAGLLLGLSSLLLLSFLPALRQRLPGRRILLYLICAALVGPGLLVNATFKAHWQRPRPAQIEDFGGSHPFSPPLLPGSDCPRCRSFVSGHASVGFYLFAFALLSGRRRWLLLPVLAGTIIGAVRIMQGGHFFSDVLFSGWVVWFSSWLLYRIFFGRPPFAADDSVIDPHQPQPAR